MAYENDTADDHVDLFDRLIDFLQRGTTTPGGPDWTLLDYESGGSTGDAAALFEAPGISGDEEIHVGVSLHSSTGADAYSLGFWMFRAYNDALDFLSQPGYSGRGFMPIWNQSMPYWFIANGQRLMIAAKVSTVYPASYVGKFLPYGTPGEYAQPYYMGNTVGSATTRWSTVSENDRNFWDPGPQGKILLPNGTWRTVQNFLDVSGENDMSSSNYVWPFQAESLGDATKIEYRRLRENVDGSYPLWPLILFGTNPDRDVWGELDGAYAVSGFNNASENTIEIDGTDYLVLQNLFRTSRYYYAALKLE